MCRDDLSVGEEDCLSTDNSDVLSNVPDDSESETEAERMFHVCYVTTLLTLSYCAIDIEHVPCVDRKLMNTYVNAGNH